VRGEPRPIQITLLQAPQDDAVTHSPGDAGGEARGGGAIFLVDAGAEDFVQRAQGQPAARQGVVDRRGPKRQHATAQRVWPLDPADAVLQSDKGGSR
jgi:hypothetical protein